MSQSLTKSILFATFAVVAVIWFYVFSIPDKNLHIVACDIGQGDAFLITNENNQILVDGGGNNKVLSCLGEKMPFWDRKIEAIILTNPDRDHYYGLTQVLERYEVDSFIASPLEKEGSSEYGKLKKAVVANGAKVVNPWTGTQIKIGGIVLDTVWPSTDVVPFDYEGSTAGVLGVFTSKREVNEYSIVFNLHFGEFDALFTGDIVPDAIEEVIETDKLSDVEFLKVPHHGSKNGLTDEMLQKITPEVAVISSGEGNSYGHPHKEVLDLLEKQNVRLLRTDTEGDVEVISDGKSWWVLP